MIRYEVLDVHGDRVALCNDRELAKSYQARTPMSTIREVHGTDYFPKMVTDFEKLRIIEDNKKK